MYLPFIIVAIHMSMCVAIDNQKVFGARREVGTEDSLIVTRTAIIAFGDFRCLEGSIVDAQPRVESRAARIECVSARCARGEGVHSILCGVADLVAE